MNEVIVVKSKKDMKLALQVIRGVAEQLEDKKLCATCLEFKNVEEFYPREYPRHNQHGSYCKTCIAKGNSKKGKK